MPGSRGYRILAKIAFGNRQSFISECGGNIDQTLIDRAVRLWFSPRGRKLTEVERTERKRRVLKQVRDMNYRIGLGKSSIKLSEKTLGRIDQLVEASCFTKNRKAKLRVFLFEMARWRRYITNMPVEQLYAMDAIYWDFSVHVINNHIPLPSSLLGSWVSGDVPARKPAERFEQEILNRLKDDAAVKLFRDSYYLDRTGRRYVLRRSVTEQERRVMEKALRSIGYSNKSGTKYREFMKYLISRGVVELKVSYSTHGRCNYYTINI